jgi:hypothetical protein
MGYAVDPGIIIADLVCFLFQLCGLKNAGINLILINLPIVSVNA